MSKQIKKKFLAQEVISYFDDQIVAVDQAVTQEAQAREQAVQTLQVTVNADLSEVESDIAQEVLDRQAGDAALQSQITNLLSNVDPASLDSLSEVVAAFEAADSNLNNAISSLAQSASSALATEQAARIAADSALQNEIDAEELARAAGDNTLQVKIDAEEAARIATDALKVNKAGDSLTGSHSWLVEYAQNETDQVLIQAGSIGVSYIYGNEIYTSSLIGGNLSLNDTGPNYTSQIQMLGGQVTLKYNDVASMPTEEFHASTKKYVDQEVASVESYADSKVLEEKGLREASDSALDGRITTLESQIGQNLQQAISDLQAADSVLDGKISTEKARIDAILDASQADKDSFAEIVQLINSVDLENDNGLASAVQSINSSIAAETAARQAADSSLSSDLSDLDVYAQDIRSDLDSLDVYAQDVRSDLDQEVLDRQAGDLSSLNSAKAYTDAQIASMPSVDLSGINSSISSLQAADVAIDTRLDALEAVQVPRIVEDEEHVQGSTLTHIMLDYKAEKIFKVCVGRVNVFKGKDYSVSEEGGKTKLTWIGFVAQGGSEAMVSSDEIMVTYSTLDAESGVGQALPSVPNLYATRDFNTEAPATWILGGMPYYFSESSVVNGVLEIQPNQGYSFTFGNDYSVDANMRLHFKPNSLVEGMLYRLTVWEVETVYAVSAEDVTNGYIQKQVRYGNRPVIISSVSGSSLSISKIELGSL